MTSAGSTACRLQATPTTPGSSTSSTTWRPQASRASCSPTASHVVQSVGRRGDSQEHHRGRPRGLHGGDAGPALLLDADSGLPLVPRPRRKNGRFRDRRGETLFIDARKMGTLVDRVHRELTDEDIAKIAGTYHAWRGDKGAGEYATSPASARPPRSMTSEARPRAHARALRGCRGGRRRRRAIRGEDAAAHDDAARAAGRSREAGRRHRRQPEGAWVWRVSGAIVRGHRTH